MQLKLFPNVSELPRELVLEQVGDIIYDSAPREFELRPQDMAALAAVLDPLLGGAVIEARLLFHKRGACRVALRGLKAHRGDLKDLARSGKSLALIGEVEAEEGVPQDAEQPAE